MNHCRTMPTSPDPTRQANGISVETVRWLRSGTRSGLVRVSGTRDAEAAFELPELLLDGRSYTSLPDPRGDWDRHGWRAGYVVGNEVAASAEDWQLQWKG